MRVEELREVLPVTSLATRDTIFKVILEFLVRVPERGKRLLHA